MASSPLKDQLDALKNEVESQKSEKLGSHDPTQAFSEYVKEKHTNVMKPRRTLKGHFGKVYSLHWAGENCEEKLVSASQDGKLIVWNAMTTNKTQAIPLRSSWVMTCAFERSGNSTVACGGLDNLCSLYSIEGDAASGKAMAELAHHDGYLSCCRFVSKGSEMITSSGDSTCINWDVQNHTPKDVFGVHTSDVMSVEVCPTDENMFVSGSCDAKCIVWDKKNAIVINAFHGHESDINSVTFFPDGNSFGTGSDDSSCRFFDLRCMNQLGEYAAEHILCGVTSAAFSKSGRCLFAGYDDYAIHTWDTMTAKYDKNSFHENRVSCVGVETTGRSLCTGSWDTLLKILA